MGAGRSRLAPIPIAAVALASMLALSSCGGEPVEPAAAGDLRAGSVATLADCSDWRQAGIADRLATIAQVRSQVGGPGQAPSLPDEEAYRFFERACAPGYASSFRLYKLFNRGASFRSLAEAP